MIEDLEEAVSMLETILESTRSSIVAYFYYFKELKAKDLVALTQKVNSTIVHHLKILDTAGVIEETRVIWKTNKIYEKYYKLTESFSEVYQNQLSIFDHLLEKNPKKALQFFRRVVNLVGISTASSINRYSMNLQDLVEEYQYHKYKGMNLPNDVIVGVAFREETYVKKVRPLIDEIFRLADEEQRIYGEAEISFEEILETRSVKIISLPTKLIFPKSLAREEIGFKE